MTSSICLLIKDEGRYLPEWLAHYFALGFDAVSVYDNESHDETRKIEKYCADIDSRVSVVDWPDIIGKNPQTSAYAHSLSNCKTDWIAFFDTDEFLVLKHHSSISEYLDDAPAETGAIAINWLNFGSNGETKYRDEPVVERFRMCSENRDDLPGRNRHVKCIARREAIAMTDRVHSPMLKDGFVYVDGNLSPVSLENRAFTPTVRHETAQINHYVVRSREEFEEKRARGMSTHHKNDPAKFSKFDDVERFWRGHDLNERLDDTIDRWACAAKPLYEKFRYCNAK